MCPGGEMFECSVCKEVKGSGRSFSALPYRKGIACMSCYVKKVLPYRRKLEDGGVYE